MNSFVILLLLTGTRLISHSKNVLMCDLLKNHNASGQSITIIKGSGKNSFLLEDGVRYVINPSIMAELNLPSICQLNDEVVLAIPRDGFVEQNGCTLKNYSIPDRFNGTYAGMQCLNHIPTTAFDATEILQFRQKLLHDDDFLPYERCIIDSPKELDERSTYYQQPHCASSSSSYPPTGMELTCTMGFGHEVIGNIGPKRLGHGCLSRGIHNRAFKYIYALGDTNDSDSLSLVKELINKKVESLVFIGDSVTIQLGKQLACDILRFDRKKLTMIPKWPSIFQGVKYGVAGIQLNVGNGTSAGSLDFRVIRTNDYVCNGYNYRGIMYVSPECISEQVAEESAYQDIFSELKRIAEGSKGRVVMVYNIGLHMSRNHSSWIFKSVARALLDVKKNASNFENVTILFRETSAQHFNHHKGGLFDDASLPNATRAFEMTESGPQFCCRYFPLDESRSVNWRNDYLFRTLTAIDEYWNRSIGWVPFYDASSYLYDMHIEHGHGIDCTHYIYSPHMMGFLWRALQTVAAGLLT